MNRYSDGLYILRRVPYVTLIFQPWNHKSFPLWKIFWISCFIIHPLSPFLWWLPSHCDDKSWCHYSQPWVIRNRLPLISASLLSHSRDVRWTVFCISNYQHCFIAYSLAHLIMPCSSSLSLAFMSNKDNGVLKLVSSGNDVTREGFNTFVSASNYNWKIKTDTTYS